MFCGQCGRAITSADIAAFAAEQEAAAAAADQASDVGALGEGPAWALREPPAAAVPAGTPWWVTERAGDAGDAPGGVASAAETHGVTEAAPAGDAATVDEPAASPVGAIAGAAESDGADAAAEQSAPADDAAGQATPEVPASEAPAAEAPGPEAAAPGAPAPEAAAPETPAPQTPAPAPLRQPGPVMPGASVPSTAPTSTGRPTSVPLWTASLTPITPEMQAEAAAAKEAQPEMQQSAITESEADADAPRPGDTNVIPPLVTPSAARPDGRQHCTVCGAALADDDIFCGECGTVVQSVAQSFTGPITPILTHPVAPEASDDEGAVDRGPEEPDAEEPDAEEPDPGEPPLSERRAPEQSDDERLGAAGDSRADEGAGSSAASIPRPAPLVPTPVAPPTSALPPFVPDPEPAPKKRRLFGRRASREAPKLWADGAPATDQGDTAASPVPPPPPSSADAEPLDLAKPPADPPIGLSQVPVASDDAPAAGEATPEPVRAAPVVPARPTSELVMAPVPPAPESPRPVAPWAVGAATDDVEETRIVGRRPLGEAFTLQFSTGESFTVQGTGLVGRAPTPEPGDMIDLLVRIVDPGKSVSKTHLEFGQDDGSLWISDRWSGNGTVLRPPAAAARRCEPGRRVRVPRGSRVDIGEQFFTVT